MMHLVILMLLTGLDSKSYTVKDADVKVFGAGHISWKTYSNLHS